MYLVLWVLLCEFWQLALVSRAKDTLPTYLPVHCGLVKD